MIKNFFIFSLTLFILSFTGCKTTAKGPVEDRNRTATKATTREAVEKSVVATTVDHGKETKDFQLTFRLDDAYVEVKRNTASTQPSFVASSNTETTDLRTLNEMKTQDESIIGAIVETTNPNTEFSLKGIKVTQIKSNFTERFPFIIILFAVGGFFLAFPFARNIPLGIGCIAFGVLLLLAQGVLVWIALACLVLLLAWPYIKQTTIARNLVNRTQDARDNLRDMGKEDALQVVDKALGKQVAATKKFVKQVKDST